MQELQIFKNNEFGEVRTKVINNEPYFSLNDVCRILEINNPSQAKTRLNKDGVISNEVIDSMGRTQQANFINESNLYKLIFQSRKSEAEKFADWVTSEVLPSIRKHGAYMTTEVIEKTLMDPDYLIQLATNLKGEKTKRALAEAQIEKDKPKVLFADTVSASNQSCLIGELAKLISQEAIRRGEISKKIGQNNLFAWMRSNGYLCKSGERKNQPLQHYVEQGLFELKKGSYVDSNGVNVLTTTTKVTGKGIIYFINKFLGV
ncbi:phage antirepressor KilAC domain-containing protein [Finegoldia magna]|uniref:phage antirepressor KilAC domain-containing protein n=1 Tax=Finegoldia magna TaxID=1260 RepID=UPI0029003706|nr:phage antirepressor KilAC domain-containing protein [Finegoldia magna]MDU1212713.1 phage antirepressor KilAC domain-containing protein [Finegoldia magna]